MPRGIRYLVVHCTATPSGTKVEAIQRYWREHLGWKAPGYHKVILEDGTVVPLADDETICNGVAGYNRQALHVSYIGGVDKDGKTAKDTRTPEQKAALMSVLKAWRKKYPLAIIQGHRDFPGVSKKCPSFNANVEYLHL